MCVCCVCVVCVCACVCCVCVCVCVLCMCVRACACVCCVCVCIRVCCVCVHACMRVHVCVCERERVREINLSFTTGAIAASTFVTSIVNLRLITLYMNGQ